MKADILPTGDVQLILAKTHPEHDRFSRLVRLEEGIAARGKYQREPTIHELLERIRIMGPAAGQGVLKMIREILRIAPEIRLHLTMSDLMLLARPEMGIYERGVTRKFSSTQFDLAGPIADAIIAMGKMIPDEDLAGDGREDKPHVTIKYGLHTSDPHEVAMLVHDFGPVEIRSGDLSIFPAKEDAPADKQYDVLKLEIDGKDLMRLNKLISESLECTDTHPTYQPHATVAYLKPGKGEEWAEKLRGVAFEFAFNEFTFSPAEGDSVPVSLVEGGVGRYARAVSAKKQARLLRKAGEANSPTPPAHDTPTEDYFQPLAEQARLFQREGEPGDG